MKLDKISKIVAEELGVKPYIIEKINRVQWMFLKESVSSLNPKPVSLIYIGKIHPNTRWFKRKKENESTDKGDLPGIQEPSVPE